MHCAEHKGVCWLHSYASLGFLFTPIFIDLLEFLGLALLIKRESPYPP